MSGRDHRDPRDHLDPADEQDAVEDEFPPVYARALRLRYVQPSGLTCLAFFEGSFVLGGLLALAELIPWWGMLVLPVAVAVMVKINDLVAGAVERSAELVPEREQEMFRREVAPAVGQPVRSVIGTRTGPASPAGGTGHGIQTGSGIQTGPGIQIRRIGGAHVEAAAATVTASTATAATATSTEATCAALAAPTVLLQTVPASPATATAAALTAPTVLLDVLHTGQLSERQPPVPE
ncbi:hypothetical protein EDC02_3704 [Micromonospora sp. Llam0]|uniref:hypothetical protein n=1 Tax=Micromonospora sp. Llam0 TaxID=2485143 RepID=UPI000F47D848|nr:hypothetical protein [Micromonospora sp. Llam0]ROO61752.1 hypothetical protein EDC02_3704 [Micromonospora sp. Llam0]